MADVMKEVGCQRTLRVQKNGRDALTIMIDGVRLRIMADSNNPKARGLLADIYDAERVSISYTERKR